MTRKVLLILGAALLSGCAATGELEALREQPSFHVGAADGCSTANEEDKSFSTKSSRDAYAFKNDRAYRAGWRNGYLECSDRIPDAIDGGRITGERNEY